MTSRVSFEPNPFFDFMFLRRAVLLLVVANCVLEVRVFEGFPRFLSCIQVPTYQSVSLGSVEKKHFCFLFFSFLFFYPPSQSFFENLHS